MQQVLAGIGLLACAALCFWAWRRWGREAAVAATLGFFALLALGESFFRRRDLEKDLKRGKVVPFSRESSRERHAELTHTLEASIWQLQEARRDGVTALKEELRNNREQQ